MPQVVEPTLVDAYLVHWNAPEWCARAARSLLESTGVRLRCTVIDNGNTGGEALRRAVDPRVAIVGLRENLGYTGGANAALAHALHAHPRAEFVVVAAHDVQVEPDTLSALSDVARADQRIGIVGPVLTAPAFEAGGTWRGWRAKIEKEWTADERFVERDWASGTLLFMRPACIAEVGGFDESLGSYVEDVDLCLRARDAGWRVGIATGARAAGLGSASTNVTVFVDVNSLLLAVKRRGLAAVPGLLARYAYWVARGVAAAAVPGRSRARRRASLVHARDHARALCSIARKWRLVVTMAHHPERGIVRFD